MAAIVDIAACGDLVVALGGASSSRQLARVSVPILRIFSRVFSILLEPMIMGDHTRYDAANPLELREDEPAAMLNLFMIMHWKSDAIRDRTTGWLQRLAVVCEKYQCAEKLKEFFLLHIDSRNTSLLDKLVIYAIIGEKTKFIHSSEILVSHPQTDSEFLVHKDLEQLLPAGILEILRDYRRRKRAEQAIAAYVPISQLYAAVKGEPCCGLKTRLVKYLDTLYQGGIATDAFAEDDVWLQDMRWYISKTHLVAYSQNLDTFVCTEPGDGCKCDWSFTNALKEMVAKIKPAEEQPYRLCCECFRSGDCTVLHECDIHKRRDVGVA